MLHDNATLYSLLNRSIAVLQSPLTIIAGIAGIRRICSVVVLGVISRDYDFDQHAPEDEVAGTITAGNFTETSRVLHSLLEGELHAHHAGALYRSYLCQLLRCIFRTHYHAISSLSDSFLSTFASVPSLLLLHLRPSVPPHPTLPFSLHRPSWNS